MRVRLYELGSRSVGVVLIDEFPASLMVSEDGHISSDSHMNAEMAVPGLCKLEDVGGQIYLRSRCQCTELAVNDAPLEEGPLLPGDRLELQGHRFLVSYEQVTSTTTRPTRYRIQA